MDSTINYFHILIISLSWTGFFLIHSVTASIGLKRRVAKHYNHLMPAYRLTFNIFSTVLIAPILWLSFRWASEPLWHWTPVLFWVTSFISAVTIIAFYFSLKYYDMAEFMGTRQWTERNNQVEDQEQFKIGEFHRFVRHPWYSMGIILIWCRELDPVMLTSAIILSVFFFFLYRMLVVYVIIFQCFFG